jgi:hypothetical protein
MAEAKASYAPEQLKYLVPPVGREPTLEGFLSPPPFFEIYMISESWHCYFEVS